MINSTANKNKRLKIDTEGEPQPSTSSSERNLSEYQGVKKQLNMIECDIKQQTINIHCNSATFTTNVAILESVKILFPVPNAVFTGRDSEFGELSEYLTKNQIVVICGMAGIGKSECSKKFAWNNSSKYGMKLWINTDTESEQNIHKSVHEIARKLSITVADRDTVNIINDIYDYFENRKILTLFVFDNANDRRSINSLLPSKAYHNDTFIHIIITSQNSKWGKRDGKDIPTIALQPLETIHAVDVFREILEDNFDDYELALWEKLAEHLNKIPLALQIAAAYVKNEIESIQEFGMNESFSLREYINKLEEELHLIIDEPFPDDSENAYPKTIYIAVAKTLEKIKLQSAFDMLYAISYLSPNNITYDLLLNLMPEEALRKSVEILSKFSLINTNSYKHHKIIGIHRLVQWILRYHQKQKGREVQNIHYSKIFTILVKNDPCYGNHYLWLLKHEETFKEVIRDFYVLNDFSKIRVLIEYDSINSLLLICESLKRHNTTDPIKWIGLALILGSVKSFHLLYDHLDKINKELECFKTMNDEILSLFIKKIKAPAVDKFVGSFQVLLERCTNVNAIIDCEGYELTLIMLAAHRGLAKVIYLLVESGRVDLNRIDRSGWTVFHYVIGAFHFYKYMALSPNEMGSFLIDAGFKTNAIDEDGCSLLHHACKYLSSSYVKFLVEDQHLDVNLIDNNGNPPLFSCFEFLPSKELKLNIDLDDCIRILTRNGADLDIVNNKGDTIFSLIENFCPSIIINLKEKS